MAFVPNSVSFDALRALRQSVATPTSTYIPTTAPRLGGGTPQLSQAQADLIAAQRNAIKRVLSDPNSKVDRNKLVADLQRIASGKKDDGGGGLLGIVGKGFGKGLQGIGYVLGRPLALVASAGKELTDIPSGKASFGDFIEQTFDPTTSVSKFLPKSGNGWIDGIVGFIGDVALDPLTYVTFGASAFAGRAGRLALAAKAAEKANLEKIPSLLAKVENGSIARLGEWALTAAEKEALGIKSGVSWAFRSKAVIGEPGSALGKLSEKAAKVVGGNFAKGRAMVGDVPIFRPLQEVTTGRYAREAGLSMYGRVKESAEAADVIRKLAAYSSTARSNGAGRLVQLKYGSRFQDLASEVSVYEQTSGRRIYEVIENIRPAADETEQALATRISGALAELRDEANKTTADFAARRNANAYQIGSRENYVPHTLTPEARDLVARRTFKEGSRMATNIKNMLGISPSEFRVGPGPLRARTLKRGTKWLGETLQTSVDNMADGPASMAEINRISRDKLGFDWFEVDGAQYLNNYLDSVVSQTKRIAFADRLFDYGADVVRTYGQKVIPNKKLAKSHQKFLRTLDRLTDDIVRGYLGDVAADAEDVLAPRIALARSIADSRPGDAILSPEQVDNVRNTLDRLVSEIADADGIARGTATEVREAYETMMAPLRVQVADMRAAVDANDQEFLAAVTGLRDLYQRIFPDADGIPGDPRALAEDIVDGITEMRKAEKATKAAKPPVKDLSVAKTGEPITIKGFRGTGGVATRGVGDDSILGPGLYVAKDKSFAEDFARDYSKTGNPVVGSVSNVEVSLNNPLVISSNDQWRALTKDAGWEYPNPMRIGVDDPGNVLARQDIANMRAYIESLGYDGVIVKTWGTSGGYADLFGGDQVIAFNAPEIAARPLGRKEVNAAIAQATTAERAARGLEVPTSGGAVYATPEDARRAVANLEEQLRSRQASLDARLSLEQAGQALPDQAGVEVARRQIADLETQIASITAKRDSDIAEILKPVFGDMIRNMERKFNEVTPERFSQAIGQASNVVKNGQRVGDTMTIYGLDEYNDMRVFLSSDGRSGYAVKPDGDLVSVFNVGSKGMGEEAVFDAIIFSGATKLDAFDQNGFLPNMYRKFGFKEVDRLQWNWDYAPPNWKPEMGEPDVVFMQLDERISKYVSESYSAAKRIETDTSTRLLQGTQRPSKGLPGWVPGGIRDRFDNSARGGARFGGTTPPKRTSLGTRTSRVDKDIKNVRVSAQRRIATRQKEIDKLRPAVDAVTPLDIAREQWDSTVGSVYRQDVDDVIRLVGERPQTGAAAEMTAEWVARTVRTLEQLSAPGLALKPAEREAFERVLTATKGLEARLAVIESERNIATEGLDRVLKGELGGKIKDDILDGWERIQSLGIQIPPELRDVMFERVRSLDQPLQASKLYNAYKEYTKFFKVTAMLTPGFLFRNSYTAAFNNFVAGVTLGETREGLRFARNIMKNGLDAALASVPAGKRPLYERALQVAYSSGAGQTADDILAPVIGGQGKRLNKIIESKPVKKWSETNEAVEVAARFSLALSSLNRGMDYDAALMNVSRYHFDYTDVSKADEFMRAWIPFWTFASRNIPLQIVNQVARPSLYRRYEALRRNFGVSEEDQTAYPSWLTDRRPLQFPGMGPGSVINPDLPFIDMEEQSKMFTDPMRLLSQANPLVKLPIELAGGRQLYQNIPFKEGKVDVRGPLDWPAYLAGMLTGSSGTRPDGGAYTTSRVSYAIPNLIPTLAQLQRILPELGGKETYMDRSTSSRASYIGVPYRRVSDQEQFNELLRRQFAIKNYLSNLTRTGYITPKER